MITDNDSTPTGTSVPSTTRTNSPNPAAMSRTGSGAGFYDHHLVLDAQDNLPSLKNLKLSLAMPFDISMQHYKKSKTNSISLPNRSQKVPVKLMLFFN